MYHKYHFVACSCIAATTKLAKKFVVGCVIRPRGEFTQPRTNFFDQLCRVWTIASRLSLLVVLTLIWMFHPDIKDINHKQDFRNGTFVTLKPKYFSKPLQSESNWTNQIACFDQPMKSDLSDCLLWSANEVWPIRLFVLILLWTFQVTHLVLHEPYLSIWFHPSSPAVQSILSNSHLPKQSWADSGIAKIKLNPIGKTQDREVMVHHVHSIPLIVSSVIVSNLI